MSSPDDLLTVAEVAERLRTYPVVVRRRCKSGDIPATKPLGTWLIRRADLDELLSNTANEKAAS
ncbi:MAG TPA: helix-turn-helix domain-containing protein [Woeseiaceae bacterium]|nr:helix-turn-helix domain-containing protein [Woeseiaceae bacterium]